MSKALLYDATVCIGCKQCEQACADQNKLEYNDAVAAEQRQSDHKFTVVLTKDDKFMRRLCMNCQEPACASVCPVGALQKTALGPVTYDARQMYGLPLLHGCLSFQCSEVRVEQTFSESAQVCDVPGSRQCRETNGLRRNLPHRCHQVRRTRRPDCRSPAAPSRQSRKVRESHLWIERSRRDLCTAALRCAFRTVRLSHRSLERPAAYVDLSRSLSHSGFRPSRWNVAGWRVVDLAPARRSRSG